MLTPKDEEIGLKVTQDINVNLKSKEKLMDVNNEWKTIKVKFLEVGQNNLNKNKLGKKQIWMTDGKHKDKDPLKY